MASGSVAELGEPGVGEEEQPMAGPRRNIRGLGGSQRSALSWKSRTARVPGQAGCQQQHLPATVRLFFSNGCFCFAS